MRCFYFYIDDWLSSKQIEKMDAHEERGYLRLILAAASEKATPSLPDDDEELAILSKLGAQWWKPTKDREKRLGEKKSGQKLRECWQFKPANAITGRLYNEKLFDAWKRQKEFSESKSKAGKVGARRRWGDGTGIAQPSQSDNKGVAPYGNGNGDLKTKKDAPLELWERGVLLLSEYPGTESLPGKPDDVIVSRCFEIANWEYEALEAGLRKLFLSGKKPDISWAWFPKVLPQFIGGGR